MDSPHKEIDWIDVINTLPTEISRPLQYQVLSLHPRHPITAEQLQEQRKKLYIVFTRLPCVRRYIYEDEEDDFDPGCFAWVSDYEERPDLVFNEIYLLSLFTVGRGNLEESEHKEILLRNGLSTRISTYRVLPVFKEYNTNGQLVRWNSLFDLRTG